MQSKELAQYILTVVSLIPVGKVATYGHVAQLAGLPKHARLVGYVLKHMDEDVDLPWHRVMNSQGRISLNKLDESANNIQQQKLLEEGVVVIAGKVDLKKYQWKG